MPRFGKVALDEIHRIFPENNENKLAVLQAMIANNSLETPEEFAARMDAIAREKAEREAYLEKLVGEFPAELVEPWMLEPKYNGMNILQLAKKLRRVMVESDIDAINRSITYGTNTDRSLGPAESASDYFASYYASVYSEAGIEEYSPDYTELWDRLWTDNSELSHWYYDFGYLKIVRSDMGLDEDGIY